MRLLCLFGLLLVATAAKGMSVNGSDRHHLPPARAERILRSYELAVRANMNDYVDKLLENAKDFMITHGLDPTELEDITQSFSATDLIGIVWHGELLLTKGWAQDLSTIYRSGDVNMEYNNQILTITANLGFQDLTFNYDFSAKFMDIGPTGNVNGKANQVQVLLKVEVNLDTQKVALLDFSISHVGDITLDFSGMGSVADWLVDQLSNVVLDIAKGPILDKVQEVLKGSLADALANIDIGDFLPPI